LCYYIIDYMRNLMILGAKEYKWNDTTRKV
jgi:hypothetical protein